MCIYYVYAYLRSKDSKIAKAGTPYYIGKGKARRMYAKHTIPAPKDKNLITVLAHELSENEALLLEIKLIDLYGRVDLGTGILRNLTSGGDGQTGYIWSEDAKKRASIAKSEWHKLHDTSGENNPMFGKTHSEELCLASKERAIRTGFVGCRKGKEPWNKGRKGVDSNETRSKRSASRLLTPKTKCPHCGLLVAPHILSRWHGDKCKKLLTFSQNLVG